MSDQRWIIVRNWRKFQHYGKRTPPWIKVYTDLLDNPNYRQLGPFHRALLHGIWLMYAAGDGEVPASPAYLSTRLGIPTEAEAKHRRRQRQRRQSSETEHSGDLVVIPWRFSGDSMVIADDEAGDRPIRMRDLKRLEQTGWIKLSTAPLLADKTNRASASRARARDREVQKQKSLPAKEASYEALEKLGALLGQAGRPVENSQKEEEPWS